MAPLGGLRDLEMGVDWLWFVVSGDLQREGGVAQVGSGWVLGGLAGCQGVSEIPYLIDGSSGAFSAFPASDSPTSPGIGSAFPAFGRISSSGH